MGLHNDIDTTGCGVSWSGFHDVFCFNNWRQSHKRMNALCTGSSLAESVCCFRATRKHMSRK